MERADHTEPRSPVRLSELRGTGVATAGRPKDVPSTALCGAAPRIMSAAAAVIAPAESESHPLAKAVAAIFIAPTNDTKRTARDLGAQSRANTISPLAPSSALGPAPDSVEGLHMTFIEAAESAAR